MTHRLVRLLAIVLSAGASACHVSNDSTRVELLTAIEPSSTCQLSTSGQPVTLGMYDPTVNEARGYTLSLLLRNNMAPAADDPVAEGPTININSRSRGAQVTAIEGCYYLADGASALPPRDGAELVDCSTVPTKLGVLATGARADEGGGLLAMSVNVLALSQLRELFGASFDPLKIPAEGAFVWPDPSINPSQASFSQSGAPLYGYRFITQAPGDARTRSAAWGDAYPSQREATVVLQLRARMQLQTGEAFVTNYLSFPVTICPGCLQDRCAPLVQKVCARGPCGDGTPCLSDGTCADTTLTCSAVTMFSGSRPDFNGISGTPPCLPAQNFLDLTPPLCLPVGCDAVN